MSAESSVAKPETLSLSLSILGYREDGEWVALALEMDLRGYGPTFEDASRELAELVTAQLGFARQKAQPDLVYHPAEPVYWRMYGDAQRETLSTLARPSGRESELRVGAMPVPVPEEIAEGAGEYELD